MIKPGHIFKKENEVFSVLSNSFDRIIYRKLGFPYSSLYNENRESFELKIKKNEYEKIEGKLILSSIEKEWRYGFSEWDIFRNKNGLYRIISKAEKMIVFQEMNFPTSKLYQTTYEKFKKLIESGTIQKRIYKDVEVGDIYILARTSFTYEILSIDRHAMVIKRFFKGKSKVCKNYGFYQFCKDVINGKYILI